MGVSTFKSHYNLRLSQCRRSIFFVEKNRGKFGERQRKTITEKRGTTTNTRSDDHSV